MATGGAAGGVTGLAGGAEPAVVVAVVVAGGGAGEPGRMKAGVNVADRLGSSGQPFELGTVNDAAGRRSSPGHRIRTAGSARASAAPTPTATLNRM
ncbi:hypothetical protein AOZ06_31960 [Kibdelosporangium phytohabitans]|uniref:Uncharacterized protein n=1 Tax=Kibdelosporangium phytohabitans TaxID=860235 RepID=A0A0N7F4A5_9PSEU|nr:hypothetical protein AOZ06_31960 [Kibdelosporangium phytohabitans]